MKSEEEFEIYKGSFNWTIQNFDIPDELNSGSFKINKKQEIPNNKKCYCDLLSIYNFTSSPIHQHKESCGSMNLANNFSLHNKFQNQNIILKNKNKGSIKIPRSTKYYFFMKHEENKEKSDLNNSPDSKRRNRQEINESNQKRIQKINNLKYLSSKVLEDDIVTFDGSNEEKTCTEVSDLNMNNNKFQTNNRNSREFSYISDISIIKKKQCHNNFESRKRMQKLKKERGNKFNISPIMTNDSKIEIFTSRSAKKELFGIVNKSPNQIKPTKIDESCNTDYFIQKRNSSNSTLQRVSNQIVNNSIISDKDYDLLYEKLNSSNFSTNKSIFKPRFSNHVTNSQNNISYQYPICPYNNLVPFIGQYYPMMIPQIGIPNSAKNKLLFPERSYKNESKVKRRIESNSEHSISIYPKNEIEKLNKVIEPIILSENIIMKIDLSHDNLLKKTDQLVNEFSKNSEESNNIKEAPKKLIFVNDSYSKASSNIVPRKNKKHLDIFDNSSSNLQNKKEISREKNMLSLNSESDIQISSIIKKKEFNSNRDDILNKTKMDFRENSKEYMDINSEIKRDLERTQKNKFKDTSQNSISNKTNDYITKIKNGISRKKRRSNKKVDRNLKFKEELKPCLTLDEEKDIDYRLFKIANSNKTETVF